ncbi:hypothetical protein [Kocuria rosea]|uniref:hypothetical protein n=1 Tax=Kocuria rosea TaxID=1275 RepID=UPI0030176136
MSSTPTMPDPPVDLAEAGARLWRSVASTYSLDVVEQEALRQACYLVDLAGRIEVQIDEEGLVMRTSQGPTVSRLLTEVRQARAAAVAMLRTLAVIGTREAPEQPPAARGRGRR